MTDTALSAALSELLERFRAGQWPALARAISIVENGRPGAEALLHVLHGDLGRGHRIGITGPPGAGKSTLSTQLITHYRRANEQVGVIAVDPTSPFTGGALLGDRIRMNEVATDAGVFIRSMATRGSIGGLAVATKEATDVLDAFGFDRILIETVGVGQSELDVAAAADTTVVVLVPESGDAIQTMKAGLMEIADLFVINKADRPGAERLAREVETMLHMRAGTTMRNVPAHHGVDLATIGRRARVRAGQPPQPDAVRKTDSGQGGESNAAGERPEPQDWIPPVLRTVAETGEGVEGLAETLDRHRAWLGETGELSRRRRARLAERVREVVERELKRIAWEKGSGAAVLDAEAAALEDGKTTPYEVAARIVAEVTG